MFWIESFLKKSGKPRCTGLWAWGDNHMRAVELYRESIEASQVWVVITLKILMPLGLLRNEMIKK